MKRAGYLLGFTLFVALFCLAIRLEDRASASSKLGDLSYAGTMCLKVQKAPGITCSLLTGHGYAVLITRDYVAVFKLGPHGPIPMYEHDQP